MSEKKRKDISQISEVYEEVKAKASPPAKLLNALRHSITEVQIMRQSFIDTILNQPKQIIKKCENSIDYIKRLFDELEKVIEESIDYILENKSYALEESIRRYRELEHRLNSSLILLRETILSAIGPTIHGGINLIIQNSIRYLKTNNPESFKELKNVIMQEKAKTISDIERLSKEPPNLLSEDYLKFNIDYLKILDDLDKLTQTKEHELKILAKKLIQLGERRKSIDPSYIEREFSNGQSNIPKVNLLINCLKLYKDGKLKEETILFIIKQFRDLLAKFQKKLPDAEREDQVARNNVIKALNSLRKRVESCGDAVLKGDIQAFAKCEQALIHDADILENRLSELTKYSDNRGYVPCPCCGEYNAFADSLCTYCKIELPFKLIETHYKEKTEYNRMNMKALVFKLFDASDLLAKGNISRGEFERMLNDIEDIIKKMTSIMHKTPPEDSDSYRNEEVRLKLKEIQKKGEEFEYEFLSGLNKFREFAKDESILAQRIAKEKILESLKTLAKFQKILFPFIENKIPRID